MAREDMLLAIGVGAPELPQFDIPEGLDLMDLEDGEEREILAKITKNGDKISFVSIDGIPLGEKEDMMDEFEDEEEIEDEASESELSTPGRYDIGAPPGTSVGSRAREAGLM